MREERVVQLSLQSGIPHAQGTRPATYPLILGHEAIGRVLQPGRSGLAEGTRVVIEPNIPCGAGSPWPAA